jgi:hypothetical protein
VYLWVAANVYTLFIAITMVTKCNKTQVLLIHGIIHVCKHAESYTYRETYKLHTGFITTTEKQLHHLFLCGNFKMWGLLGLQFVSAD